jgi:hypothetical protein
MRSPASPTGATGHPYMVCYNVCSGGFADANLCPNVPRTINTNSLKYTRLSEFTEDENETTRMVLRPGRSLRVDTCSIAPFSNESCFDKDPLEGLGAFCLLQRSAPFSEYGPTARACSLACHAAAQIRCVLFSASAADQLRWGKATVEGMWAMQENRSGRAAALDEQVHCAHSHHQQI